MKSIASMVILLGLNLCCSFSQTLIFEKTHMVPWDNEYRGMVYTKFVDLPNGNSLFIDLRWQMDTVYYVFKDSSRANFLLFDEEANLIKQNSITLPHFHILHYCASSDGGFSICGRIDTTSVIMHFNEDLELDNLIQLPGMGRNEVLDLITEIDGDYIVRSSRHTYIAYEYFNYWYPWFSSYDMYYFKTELYLNRVDASGNILWQSLVDTTGTIIQLDQYYEGNNVHEDTTQYFTDRLLHGYHSNIFYFNYTQGAVIHQNPVSGDISTLYAKIAPTPDSVFLFYWWGQQRMVISNTTADGASTVHKELNQFTAYDGFYAGAIYPLADFMFGVTGGVYNSTVDSMMYTRYRMDYYGNTLDSFTYFIRSGMEETDDNYIAAYAPVGLNQNNQVIAGNVKNYLYDPEQNTFISRNMITIHTFDDNMRKLRKSWAEIGEIYLYYHRANFLKTTSDNNFLFALAEDYDVNLLHFYKIPNKGNQLTVLAYIDINNNGVFDNGETRHVRCKVEITDENTSSLYTFDPGGMADISLDSGIYVSRLVSHHQNLNAFHVFPDSIVTDLRGSLLNDTAVFRLVPKAPFQNLEISISPNNTARPGFSSNYTVNVSNYGSQTAYYVRAAFLKDSFQVYDTSAISPYAFSGDTLVHFIDSISLYRSLSFEVKTVNAIPPELDMGDTISLQAFVYGEDIDSFPADNYFLLRQDIRNSSDPNDKSESHGGSLTRAQLQNRDYMYYTIRFQNVGNDYAYRVVVKDTLSDKLDWNTLQMVAASHDYTLEVKNKRYVTWTFDAIYLADSTNNEPESHGYITFRIRPKAGLSVNDVITNRASIIFDFNQAIVTNTVSTSVIDERVTIVKNNEIRSIKLYPSPTSDVFTLEINITDNGSYDLLLMDITGKTILSEKLELYPGRFSKQISLENMPANLYLISLQGNNGPLFSGKVLKQ